MFKSEYGVHISHCCAEHGCKYGDENCPVVSGEVKQKYLCEWCSDEDIKSLEELYESMKDYKSMWVDLITRLKTFADKSSESNSLVYRDIIKCMEDMENMDSYITRRRQYNEY